MAGILPIRREVPPNQSKVNSNPFFFIKPISDLRLSNFGSILIYYFYLLVILIPKPTGS